MSKHACIVVTLASLVGLTAGGALAETIRIAEVTDATTFDPHYATDNTTISMNEHIFEGLLKRDLDGTLEPSLAESWELAEDQITWTFKLRQGVEFSDGAPFNAEAAKTSIDRILDPDMGAAGRARISGIESVDIVDDYTLKVTTQYPWPELLDGLAGNSTRVISPQALEEFGEGVSRRPVGTGPFVLADHQTGQEIVLERNENYWGGKPVYERIVVSVAPEAAVRSSLIQAGEVDIILKINPENVSVLESDANVEVIKSPSTFSVFYMFNLFQEPMNDHRVREAINIAIDREAIVNGLLEGAGEVPRSIFAGAVQYRKELDPIPYDPDRARELLREAGFENGLSLKMWSAPRYLKDREISQAVQAYLRQVGVTLTIDMADWGTHWARINEEERDVDLYLLATTITEPSYRLQWNFGRGAGRYWSGYGDESLWEMIETASRTLEDDKRADLFGQLQTRIWNDLPYLFLYDRTLISAVRSDIEGFRLDGREIWDLKEVRRIQ